MEKNLKEEKELDYISQLLVGIANCTSILGGKAKKEELERDQTLARLEFPEPANFVDVMDELVKAYDNFLEKLSRGLFMIPPDLQSSAITNLLSDLCQEEGQDLKVSYSTEDCTYCFTFDNTEGQVKIKALTIVF